ncbi:MAG: CBS domain-containing protein, partial [Lentisphaerae bacterium]|nr:CBS domain-containing protein [Lentisphaerota bacterium]
MSDLKASDIMISNVITVSADATLHEVADLLMTRHISGA